MASVEFCDEEDNSLIPLHSHPHLQDNVVRMTIWAEFGGDYDCDFISTMLNNFPKKLRKVTIYDIYRFSPDYVALFALILNKTERLELSDSLRRNLEVCQAFQHHSIKELDLYQLGAISTSQARYIFDGIAYSSSLQKLHLDIIFEEHEVAIPLLVDALRQNRSLKSLSLNLPTVEGDRFFSNAIRAAVVDMKLKCLSIGDPRCIVQLPMDDLMEATCRPDCSLERFSMRGIEPSPVMEESAMDIDTDDGDIFMHRNTSVKELIIWGITLDCSRIMDTVGLFQSLVSLQLVDTNISNLSPLDRLLIGDNLTLQHLSLGGHHMTNQDLLQFVLKLPEMKCLRHLKIAIDAKVQTDSWKDALADALLRNKSLEQVNVGRFTELQCENKYNVQLHVNRAWKPSSKQMPKNLWPQVLQRATRLLYYRDNDDWEKPSLEVPRRDATFWLLKEMVVPQSYC
ncbi:unnamed protein product [Cylindrotheca closterium]|uniref:Uncharacterized protein n=1 Tax=Cylindrotheca closterium TaxID=2856 RepID=A0AAD2PUJ2_9STRA|nr:unnamed protein product [Cylindrotheca closterium]